ncbi:hypothetical protein [Actinoplanes sp. HUAS TT8]|uniref:hypothetical protein n=1 Tax=Actinoplanes sp. HUAS TT8 TaxID=3447453 RepID=UPI003F526FE6
MRAPRPYLWSVFSVVLLLTTATPANAADYPSFEGVKTIHLTGSAAIVKAGPGHRAVLRLTGGGYRQAGAAWDHARVDVTGSFTSEFYAMLDGPPGTGNLAFVLRDAKRNVAIRFADDRIGLNGEAGTKANIPLTGSPFMARITYDAPTKNLRAYLSAPDGVEQPVVDRTVDLGATPLEAGFTGSATITQDIISWELQTSDSTANVLPSGS